ncbi:MAG: glycosyltransferase family 4 protein [Acidimicrobiales bacterium]
MSQQPKVDGLRLGIIRPDFGGRGGFERHLESVTGELVERGWDVESIVLDGCQARTRLFGFDIKPVQHEFHDDYFKYLSLVAQVAELELSRFDVVLTTQPPTYLARHPRKVALFYHQARQFYDLAEPYLTSGFAAAEVHHQAIESVHRIDRAGIADVQHWLAGSATTADRLEYFWSIPRERISHYQAPPECTIPPEPTPHSPAGPILHVGRFEWPKRAELLVEALHRIPAGPHANSEACFVGSGSRMEFVRSLDARLGAEAEQRRAGLDLTDPSPAEQIWMNRGIFTAGWEPDTRDPSGRLRFLGTVDDDKRDALYRDASMVVAPALNEDYGLTAVEAMAFARPVIVCSDGGGLTELVEHEVTGLVVPPDADELAKAIDRLLGDPAFAASLGLAGYRRVAGMSRASATSQIENALLAALADRGQLQLL